MLRVLRVRGLGALAFFWCSLRTTGSVGDALNSDSATLTLVTLGPVFGSGPHLQERDLWGYKQV